MKLVDVYSEPQAARILYDLLAEREPHQNISHERMPTWEQHCAFVASRPYQAWYLILDDSGTEEQPAQWIGAIYLTKRREIGLFVFKRLRGDGYGAMALKLLAAAHPGPMLANVSPANELAAAFWQRHGFNLKQLTYART